MRQASACREGPAEASDHSPAEEPGRDEDLKAVSVNNDSRDEFIDFFVSSLHTSTCQLPSTPDGECEYLHASVDQVKGSPRSIHHIRVLNTPSL